MARNLSFNPVRIQLVNTTDLRKAIRKADFVYESNIKRRRERMPVFRVTKKHVMEVLSKFYNDSEWVKNVSDANLITYNVVTDNEYYSQTYYVKLPMDELDV